MLGGIRHLIWDTGHGFAPHEREWLALATLVGSVVLTLLLWIVGYLVMGGRADGRRQACAPRSRACAASARPRSGTEHFWRQRLTAVANVPLTIAFVLIVVSLLGRNHAAAQQILGSPLVAIMMLLFIVSVTYHMRIGMQVIIEDYVHDEIAEARRC